jgi:hypothetical protein
MTLICRVTWVAVVETTDTVYTTGIAIAGKLLSRNWRASREETRGWHARRYSIVQADCLPYLRLRAVIEAARRN